MIMNQIKQVKNGAITGKAAKTVDVGKTQFIEFAASLCYDEYNKKEKRLDRIFLFHEER